MRISVWERSLAEFTLSLSEQFEMTTTTKLCNPLRHAQIRF
jgi:hypothetical protein